MDLILNRSSPITEPCRTSRLEVGRMSDELPSTTTHCFLSLVPRTDARACERVWLHKLLQNLKASNAIAKRCLLEYCSSKIIYVLPCESSSFTILWLSMCYVFSGPFATAGSPSYVYIQC